MPGLPPYDAILLTGGAGRRLGGVAKGTVAVGGRPLVARVAAAAADAGRLVVVGPMPVLTGDDLHRCVVNTAEEPPGSGPVAGIAAGFPHVGADQVAVLACDLPFLTPEVVVALRAALAAAPEAAVALPVDDDGRDQLLCSVWRSTALVAALARLGDPAGASVRTLVALAGVVARVGPRPGSASGGPPPWFDCDTPEDLDQAQRWARRSNED